MKEAHSEWRSLIVLLPKPDRSMSFCIEFQKVNVIFRFNAYSMPQIDELFEKLGNVEFISTLDLRKGYWQIPLTPASWEKTAFTMLPFPVYNYAFQITWGHGYLPLAYGSVVATT